MICLYYDSLTKSYDLMEQGELAHQFKKDYFFIVEKFDLQSKKMADRICSNLNIASRMSFIADMTADLNNGMCNRS